MLPFFRKIRWRLARDNQFFKYSRYAIGEIVLVVIGILIALQINNWNEDRKQRINNFKFLRNLHYEINLDRQVFTDKIANYDQINQNLKQTLEFLGRPGGVNEEERQIIVSAIRSLEVLTPSYKNVERNDIKLAEGTLENIDSNLNKKYQQYIESIKSNNDVVGKLGEALQFVVLQDLYPKVDLDYAGLREDIHFDLEKLKDDRLFKNALNRSIRYRNVSISYMKNQSEQAELLLDILNEILE